MNYLGTVIGHRHKNGLGTVRSDHQKTHRLTASSINTAGSINWITWPKFFKFSSQLILIYSTFRSSSRWHNCSHSIITEKTKTIKNDEARFLPFFRPIGRKFFHLRVPQNRYLKAYFQSSNSQKILKWLFDTATHYHKTKSRSHILLHRSYLNY